jgi:cbb3-type cytochrome oxidase maturation protein
MTPVYLLVFGSTLVMGASLVLAFWWAAKTGQFRDMKKGAESIFDAHEPVGKPTDLTLPPKKPKPGSTR